MFWLFLCKNEKRKESFLLQIYKFAQIPKSFLLQILGEQRVTKFVIQEIVNSTMADFVEKVIHLHHSLHACIFKGSIDHFVSQTVPQLNTRKIWMWRTRKSTQSRPQKNWSPCLFPEMNSDLTPQSNLKIQKLRHQPESPKCEVKIIFSFMKHSILSITLSRFSASSNCCDWWRIHVNL